MNEEITMNKVNEEILKRLFHIGLVTYKGKSYVEYGRPSGDSRIEAYQPLDKSCVQHAINEIPGDLASLIDQTTVCGDFLDWYRNWYTLPPYKSNRHVKQQHLRYPEPLDGKCLSVITTVCGNIITYPHDSVMPFNYGTMSHLYDKDDGKTLYVVSYEERKRRRCIVFNSLFNLNVDDTTWSQNYPHWTRVLEPTPAAKKKGQLKLILMDSYELPVDLYNIVFEYAVR